MLRTLIANPGVPGAGSNAKALWSVIALLLLLFAISAHADNSAEATKLFEQGRSLLKEQKYAEACILFAKSYELDRKAGTQLNLGECAEREGKLHRAWRLFDDAVGTYQRAQRDAKDKLANEPNNAEARRAAAIAAAGVKLARERADALVPRLAKIVVTIADHARAGLVVRIADRIVPPAPAITEMLDAGPVEISVSAPERQAFRKTVTAEFGKQIAVDVPPLAVEAPRSVGNPRIDPPPPQLPPRNDAPPTRRRRSRVIAAYAAGGLGVALGGLAGIGAAKARTQYREAEARCDRDAAGELVCAPEDAAQIRTAIKGADGATVGFIVAGALVATGAIVYLTAPRDRVVTAALAPSVSPSGVGVTLSGRF